jgi:hypothetical protein
LSGSSVGKASAPRHSTSTPRPPRTTNCISSAKEAPLKERASCPALTADQQPGLRTAVVASANSKCVTYSTDTAGVTPTLDECAPNSSTSSHYPGHIAKDRHLASPAMIAHTPVPQLWGVLGLVRLVLS